MHLRPASLSLPLSLLLLMLLFLSAEAHGLLPLLLAVAVQLLPPATLI